MEIHVQPDADKRQKLEQQEDPKPAPVVLEELKMGDMLLWAPKNHEKARELTPKEKIATDRLETFLSVKAEIRSQICWECDALNCKGNPVSWVREIQFDMKTDDHAAPNFRQVSSSDYDGPIPGFCSGHLAGSPARLAEAVYFSRPEMQWGLKPKRWFVIFTDGSKTGGECRMLDPKQIQPKFVEEFTGEQNGR